jgi:hypothetical protein
VSHVYELVADFDSAVCAPSRWRDHSRHYGGVGNGRPARLLKTVLTQDEHPTYEIAIALADLPTSRSLHQRTRKARTRCASTYCS